MLGMTLIGKDVLYSSRQYICARAHVCNFTLSVLFCVRAWKHKTSILYMFSGQEMCSYDADIKEYKFCQLICKDAIYCNDDNFSILKRWCDK